MKRQNRFSFDAVVFLTSAALSTPKSAPFDQSEKSGKFEIVFPSKTPFPPHQSKDAEKNVRRWLNVRNANHFVRCLLTQVHTPVRFLKN